MKINEFAKLQEKQNYKHIALYDKLDKCRVRFNGQKNSAADKLTVIQNRLESELYNDDYYIIKCKNYHTDKNTDDFIIHLTEDNINLPMPKIETKDNFINGYSFEKSLNLEVEIKKLQLENNSLNNEIESLKNEIEDLENTISELEADELLDEAPEKTDWKVFLSETLSTLAPMLDKHFELKERNIAIKECQLKQFQNSEKNNTENIDRVNNKFNEKLLDELNTKLVSSINDLNDEAQKKQIMTIYNASTDLNECIKEIYEINPQLIETLMSNINE